MTNRVSPRTLILISMLLAFGLRLYRLDQQPLRGDESFSIQFSAHEVSWLLPGIANVEPNPPLYYLLLHYWMEWLGQSEFVTRFFSLLFGVVSVPLIYQLGRSLGRPKVGILAALLLAINPFQIWHAQDVRNYTLWPALSIAALTFLLHALREGRARLWAGYAVMTLLSLYTHYYDMFMWLFQNLFFLSIALRQQKETRQLTPDLRRTVYTWMAVQAFVATAFVPWLLYGSSRLAAITEGTSPTLWAVFSSCLSQFSVGVTVPDIVRFLMVPLSLLLVLYGLVSAFKRDGDAGLFLMLYILVPSICVFSVAQVRPLFRERYLNAIAPAYYLILSWGLLSLPKAVKRWRKASLIAGVALFGLTAAYSLNNHYHVPGYQKSPEWRSLCIYLASESEPGDVVVLNYPDPSFSYYCAGEIRSFILPQGLLSRDVKADTAHALTLLAERYERIWFYPHTDVGWDDEGFVESWLNRHAALSKERDIYGFRWLIYEPFVLSLANIQHPVNVSVGEDMLLRGYDCRECWTGESGPLSVKPGNTMLVTLYWEATGEVGANYHVFVHLTDDAGHIVAQRDAPPQGGDFPTLEWFSGDVIVDPYSLMVPSDTPPGDYDLAVGMYDPSTGQRLIITSSGGTYLEDHIVIGRFTVEQ